jgi:hypothetical protein
MPVTVPLGMRSRLSVGHSRVRGWWAVRWRKTDPTGWKGWDPRWDDDSPDSGVREPRRPPPSPLQGAAELPEPD